jgi:aldehyde dehydrogenase (NAD+)
MPEPTANPLAFQTDWTYAPAPESADHFKLRANYGLFIDGRWQDPAADTWFDTVNPATETRLASVAEAGKADVDKAVKAARKAYDRTWSRLKPAERGKYLYRIARLLQERAREFAVIETMDGGKPIRESRDIDIPLAAAHFFYYAGWADKLEYAFPGRTARPVGVAGQIIPWNFPLLMAAWKIAPALAAGNTVVLKPAETTPLTALTLATLIQEADLPPGVVNIITGAGATGAALVNHPGVDKIAFTGSTEVGKLILKTLAGTGKKYTLELGGKAANIVFEDAAIDQAVEGVVNGIFFNQGHVCCAGSRLLVQESIAPVFVRKLKERMSTLIVGDPLDKNTDIGAINSKPQLQRIESYIASGREEGLTMHQPACPLPSLGYFCRPTFFENAAQSSRVVQEEIFGPVVVALPYDDIDEAVRLANDTPYGLGASIWSNDLARVHRMIPRIKAGTVWVNCHSMLDASLPFGGFKQSGIGREMGRAALDMFTETKSVMMAV